ncbi:MAG: DNA topoisomerase III [Candidatus Endonucleobacter bathymodioli]|uniref:DNA topoisomerase n=1 Tax=Candidatus Endonucleibacter bathymodioli TaxID=539814 RepID=A0AA90SXB4_9GAMM|nr:DNA topoisomerase III [Candidatus Endonucleobacter bathymodioli]
MRLIIAEKPSLGRAIADVLPKPHKKHDGYIETAGKDYVTWCVGHLLEQAEPEAYDPAYKQWSLEHLPIIPDQWTLQPRKSSRGQLGVIKKLLKRAEVIVHAGDPDREGQLLVDEVLEFLDVSPARKKEVWRLLINDLNPQAVKKALAKLQSNNDFVSLSVSALARSRADWIYGINLTRAFTLLGRREGYSGLLSVGRVQTPLLGLVVRRDLEIESFQVKPYFEVFVVLKTKNQESFSAKWIPSESCQPWMDEDGRVLEKRLAQNVMDRVEDKKGTVVLIDNKQGKESPPLLYSLSALQIDAARQLKLSASQVLESCQKLYEQKLITYPRSDCRYLPKDHFEQVREVLSAISSNQQQLAKAVDKAQTNRPGKAWNDKKVSAHHAIIPTSRKSSLARMSESETKIYGLIARQYIAQFYSDFTYKTQRIDVCIEGGLFQARSRKMVTEGWKELFNRGKTEEKEGGSPPLPVLGKGDLLDCVDVELKEKETQPMHHFNDATLLSAMTGIARYVKDSAIRKVLRKTDGLGTEATRAGIIELLFKRQFLERRGRNIHATATGRALIEALPDKVRCPDITASWESFMERIVERKCSYSRFMADLDHELRGLLVAAKSNGMASVRGLPPVKQNFRKKTGVPSSKGKYYQKKKISVVSSHNIDKA